MMKFQVNGNNVEVHVSEEVRDSLTELGIDVDKEIQQGIEQGLSNAKQCSEQST
jgi:cell division protein ZapA (FtsZ GTPase activity inhibitor)